METNNLLIGVVVLLVLGFIALAGLRIRNNNKVYGAESEAYAGSFKIFQEQLSNLNQQILSNAEKANQVHHLLNEANIFIAKLQTENERLLRYINRLQQQIRALGAEPIE